MSFGKHCAHILIKLSPLVLTNTNVGLYCVFDRFVLLHISPIFTVFIAFSILFWWIKLSPYQHQCCTVSLIASFCSINPLYLPFLSIFLHDFLVICQFEFVCIPNSMTAEPKSHSRPTKPQRESG